MGPEVADMAPRPDNQEIDQVVVDIDLFTTTPTSVAAFNAAEWLQRCLRATARDVPKFLA